MTVKNSTVRRQREERIGGSSCGEVIRISGGGIVNSGTLTLENSTLSRNNGGLSSVVAKMGPSVVAA